MWHNFWGGKRKKPCNYYEVISTFHWICMIILLQKVFDVYLRVPAHPILVPIKVTASHFISDGAWPLSRKYNSMRAFANHSFNCPIPYCFKNMDVTWMKARWLIHQYFWSANSTILSASKHKTFGFILEQNKGHFTLKIEGPWPPKSLIGGKCQDCPLHFTLVLEGLKDQGSLNGWTWIPTWNAMDNVSWSTGICFEPTSLRWT